MAIVVLTMFFPVLMNGCRNRGNGRLVNASRHAAKYLRFIRKVTLDKRGHQVDCDD